MIDILFVLKHRYFYDGGGYDGTISEKQPQPDKSKPYSTELNSGMLNSVRLVSEMLNNFNISTCYEIVIDGNDINRVVTQHRPRIVIIEALWVTTEKMAELQKIHPNVKWVIRIHSEIPFLANEGIAIDRIINGAKIPNVSVAANSLRAAECLKVVDQEIKILPNYYPITVPRHRVFDCISAFIKNHFHFDKSAINIGCFGAIRPMKNQLTQALAAIAFAEKHSVDLNFHINASRVENVNGNSALKNIRALFDSYKSDKITCNLVEHGWLDHSSFLDLLKTMDITLQVSLSETFNIVSADSVSCGVPVVTSEEIYWIDRRFKAEPSSCRDIVEKMERALKFGAAGVYLNACGLREYNFASIIDWLSFVKREVGLSEQLCLEHNI